MRTLIAMVLLLFWWGARAAQILVNGDPIESEYGPYLSSNWATPTLVDDDSGDEYECHALAEECGYNAYTQWPDEAKEALK